MATLAITSWTITALNPDGTVNTFIPAVTGSVPANPATDQIEFPAMGQRVRLEFNCVIAGTHADSSTASVIGSNIRYSPALFLAYLGVYTPPGGLPNGAYSILVPAGYSPTYQMVLVGQGEFESANQNGEVEIAIATDQTFTITHEFYMTLDIQGYPNGKYVPNKFRFSKNSILNPTEGNINGVSVYGNQRGLNVYVAFQQGKYVVIAPDLSIPIQASFNGFDQDGNELFSPQWIIEIDSTEQTYLSAFEDNLVTIRFTDPSALIVENESEIAVCNRSLNENVSGFVKDFLLYAAKLVTTGSTAQIAGPIYGPVTWSQAAGVTEISFILKGTELDPNINYQMHARAGYTSGPSSALMLHTMTTPTPTEAPPVPVDFSIVQEFWTRNGQHAESFTVAPNQRVTSVLSLDANDYNANAVDPWSTFFNDIYRVRLEIYDEDDVQVFSSGVVETGGGTFPDSQYIGNQLETGPSTSILRFYLKEFRVPYLNFQNLQNWIGQTIKFRWIVQFLTPFSTDFGTNYVLDSFLTVRPYENDEASKQVSNIQFFNPETGYPISNWCDLDSVLVKADISGIADDVYISAMVDRFPLGVQLYNDLALEEEDPQMHTLPSYVIFTQKVSDLISGLDAQPTDGSIAFLLDISGLTGDQKWRIYFEAYSVQP